VERLFGTARNHTLHREDLGKLFKLVMFELWCRVFLDRPGGAWRELDWLPARATA
jgi:hypothetical protein